VTIPDERLATLPVRESIHRGEAGEGILAVEHAGRIHRLPFLADERGLTDEGGIDRRTAHQQRVLEVSAVQLLGAQGHLLRCRDEERGEPDRVGVQLLSLLDDRVHRHLLAQVVDGITVVAQDRANQVLTDVVVANTTTPFVCPSSWSR
jgi:hypothetical protein